MRHIIKKQIVEFDLDNKLDAFHMQQEMAGCYQYGIVPVLQKVFDELSDEEMVTAIDRLEIDLGLITVREIEKKSLDNLYEKISLQVKEAALNTIKVKRNSAPITVHPTVHSSKVISIARQWLFYMQHGYLAWNTISINEIWYRSVLEAFAVDFKSTAALRHLIITNQQALKRIIYQHKESFLQTLVEILTAEKQTDLLSVAEELVRIATVIKRVQNKTPDHSIKLTGEKIWALLLVAAASAEQHLTTGRLIKKILNRIITDNAIAKSVLDELPGQIKIMQPVIQQLLKETELLLPEKPAGETHVKTNKTEITDPPATEGLKNIFEKDIQDEAPLLKNSITSPDDDIVVETLPHINEDGIFVQHAGVVLLHPFLHSFFKRLQLVQQAEFVSADAHQKAVFMVHYLATGLLLAEEHELVIPKLLCGYSFDEAVPKHIEISEEEIREATNLLEAVIAQWEILKNTSAAGLREGFLQRNGKLYSKNDNLYLQIETNSIDIVLDYLPWNLSMIKLPWMKEMLRVEWR